MDDKEIIRRLFQYGHFFNPLTPNAHNITADDLDLLTMRDSVVQMAVASWQEWNRDSISGYTWRTMNREAHVDGEIGAGTIATLDADRCGCADYPDPNEATGSGGWPKCDPERPDVHSIRINLNTSRMPSAVRGYIDQALAASVAAYAEIGLAVRYIMDGDPQAAEIEKEWQPLAGSTIGWNQFPQANTCNQTITGKLDTAWTPSDWRYFASLEIHETGHGVGLQHTRGGVMNPSITGNISYINDPSYGTLKRYYGGEPIETKPSEPKPDKPTPTTSGSNWGGYIETIGGQRILASEIKTLSLQREKIGIFEPW